MKSHSLYKLNYSFPLVDTFIGLGTASLSYELYKLADRRAPRYAPMRPDRSRRVFRLVGHKTPLTAKLYARPDRLAAAALGCTA